MKLAKSIILQHICTIDNLTIGNMTKGYNCNEKIFFRLLNIYLFYI